MDKETIIEKIQTLDELIGEYKETMMIVPKSFGEWFWVEQDDWIEPLIKHLRSVLYPKKR